MKQLVTFIDSLEKQPFDEEGFEKAMREVRRKLDQDCLLPRPDGQAMRDVELRFLERIRQAMEIPKPYMHNHRDMNYHPNCPACNQGR